MLSVDWLDARLTDDPNVNCIVVSTAPTSLLGCRQSGVLDRLYLDCGWLVNDHLFALCSACLLIDSR